MTAQLEAGREERIREIRRELSSLFDGMMQALYKLEVSQLRIEVLETPKMREFMETHAAALDSSFQKVEMTDTMRRRLQRSDYVFSGMKTFHELNEAFPSLLDENGERKPFERFLNDVRKIDETYNSNYLRAEYNFVQASAEMAAKWERFIRDGDRYHLQYRTAGDDKVRPEHAELHGITLPPGDPFWEEYFPPNGWNCRCDVVQVRKSRYPATPADEARRRAESVFGDGKSEMFRFNPGKQEKAVPDYNPYTIRQCGSCDLAKKAELAKRYRKTNCAPRAGLSGRWPKLTPEPHDTRQRPCKEPRSQTRTSRTKYRSHANPSMNGPTSRSNSSRRRTGCCSISPPYWRKQNTWVRQTTTRGFPEWCSHISLKRKSMEKRHWLSSGNTTGENSCCTAYRTAGNCTAT